MTPRAAELVRLLDLMPHPEGGCYREHWRTPSPPGVRAASTAIYFLLDRGQLSRWHRVDADEIWSHLEGDPLDLWLWEPGKAAECRVLGPARDRDSRPTWVVPAGVWQAASPKGGPVLTGCIVAPGFEFQGFSLLSDQPALAARLRDQHPDLERFL
jgi:predicted cupin superfamily sugar epimerase